MDYTRPLSPVQMSQLILYLLFGSLCLGCGGLGVPNGRFVQIDHCSLMRDGTDIRSGWGGERPNALLGIWEFDAGSGTVKRYTHCPETDPCFGFDTPIRQDTLVVRFQVLPGGTQIEIAPRTGGYSHGADTLDFNWRGDTLLLDVQIKPADASSVLVAYRYYLLPS